MKAADVISALSTRGVELWQEGGTLRYRARAGTLTEQDRVTLRAHKASILKALAATPSQPTATAGASPVAPSIVATEALPTYTEPPEPVPKERLCYQCQHFARSSYGYPLGLCVEYGNRIQHSTSEPAKFWCGAFEPKEVRA